MPASVDHGPVLTGRSTEVRSNAWMKGLVVVARLSLGVCLLASCSESVPSRSAGDAAERASPIADGWLGRWDGPEGTFLLLERADGGYDVTIRNLDGPRTFRGHAVRDQVQFERDGMTEVMRSTDGAATGMKWLSDKSSCLTIRYGEGFCRD
jgi:hypothetical protein